MTLKVRIVLLSTFNSKMTKRPKIFLRPYLLTALNSASCRKATLGTLSLNMYLQSFCFIVLGSINTMIMMIKITNTIPPTTSLILDFEDVNFDEPLNGTFSSSTCIRVVIISLKATLVFFSFSYKKRRKK